MGGEAKKKEGQRGFLAKARHMLLWPTVLVFLTISAIVFAVGLLGTLGFEGTTPVRSVLSTDPIWKNFATLFKSQKGAPYAWVDGVVPTQNDNLVKFDKRLIGALSYLSAKRQNQCGFDGQHQSVALSIKSDSLSDLSYPEGNVQSTATLSRGTGVRILYADEIKCTKIPKNQYCDVKEPRVFVQVQIPLSQDQTLKANEDYDKANCLVRCGVGYYPNTPIDAPADEITSENSVAFVSKYNPGEFDYKDISENGKKASVYKAVQIGFELLHIDDAGCATTGGNSGFSRQIPTTIIFPNWVVKAMGDDWQPFIKMAEQKFPYNFQKGSPLAGLTYDPVLDNQGLHFNY
ncbi:MAG: hypothetical protein NTZ65_00465 [Candidatus Berkelbacteria bacterium]|nr:hypothetical protein [Candidatus Berkelbacteria bacterium]